MNQPEEGDSESADHLEKEFRFMRAAKVRKDALEEQRRAGAFNLFYYEIVVVRTAVSSGCSWYILKHSLQA